MRTKSEEKYLQAAVGVALTSKCRFKHGTIIIKSGKVLAAEPNVSRNDPRVVDWTSCSEHSEVRAMRRAGWPVRAKVFTGRVNRKGTVMMGKPCESCQAMLDEFKCTVLWTGE